MFFFQVILLLLKFLPLIKMATALSVTFERHRESLGVGDPTPRISWRFKGEAQKWIQASYDIEILRPVAGPAKPEFFMLNLAILCWCRGQRRPSSRERVQVYE